MSTHSNNSLQPARRQYFIKSDALSRIQQQQQAQQPTSLPRNGSDRSLDEFMRAKAVPTPKNPKTNDLPGILALALKESSVEHQSPPQLKSERSYFEVGHSMRRISLSQSGARVDKSLESSCMVTDCPNKNVRVHYEELKSEYNEKIREIRRLTKLLEVGERGDTVHGHIRKQQGNATSETVEIESLRATNAQQREKLLLAETELQRLQAECAKKEEMLERCQSYTDEQMRYIEATTKPNLNAKRDSAKTVKVLKAKLLELEKSNRSIKAHSAKLLQELEDVKGNYSDLCLKFEKSELNRSKVTSAADSKTADKMIKDLQSEKRLLTEDVRALKDAHARATRDLEARVAELGKTNVELTEKCRYSQDDFGKLRTAYDKLLNSMEETESSNASLKAQFRDQKHRSDTLERERANLEDELEALKGRYVGVTKEKADVERKLFNLNEKLFDLYALIRNDSLKSPRADFKAKSIELISDAELDCIRHAVAQQVAATATRRPSTDRKLPDAHNPFKSFSNSVSEQKLGFEAERSLPARFSNFVGTVRSQYDKLRIDAGWLEVTAGELLAELNEQDARAAGADVLQAGYARLKEDSDKTGFMLSSLIEALNVDIKRKTKVWTSFSPGLDTTNYALVVRLAQALELAQAEHDESDLRQSHRSEDVPSPKKSRSHQSGLLDRNLFSVRAVEQQAPKRQREAVRIAESNNPQQLLLLSHLMSNRESESLASQAQKHSARDGESLLDALRLENETLRRQLAKYELHDQSLNRTADNIMTTPQAKATLSEEPVAAELERLRGELEALREENDLLRTRLNDASMAMRLNGINKGSSEMYDLINQTNFFPHKGDTQPPRADATCSEPELDGEAQSANLSQCDPQLAVEVHAAEYIDTQLRPTVDERGDQSAHEFIYELAELEDEQAVQEFVQNLVDVARDLEKDNKELKAQLAEMQIEHRKLQLDAQGDVKLAEELEYYKVKLASLELAHKIGGQLKPQKSETSKQDTSRRVSRQDEEALESLRGDLTRLEALNSELGAQVFKLTEQLKKESATNAQLRAELDELRGRASVSGFLQGNSELLNSEVYALNLSDLNPNRAVAQLVQEQLTTEEAARLQDRLALLEEQRHNAVAETETLRAKLTSVEREHTQAKHRNAELLKQVELLTEENAQQTQQLAQIKSRILDGRGSHGGDNSGFEAEIRRLQSQTIHLSDSLRKATKAHDALLTENASLAKENKDLSDIRRKLYLQVTKLSAKSLHKDAELEKKTYRLSNALVQVAILKSELERLAFA